MDTYRISLLDGLYVDDSVAVDSKVLAVDQGRKNSTLTKQELRLQLRQGHTLNDLLAFGPGQDFINECQGDVEKTERLFCCCDWQHPSSAMDELTDDGEDTFQP